MRHSRSAPPTIRHPLSGWQPVLNRRLPALGRGEIEGQRLLRRARHDHTYRLARAGVHLDVHQMRRHPHEIAGMRLLRLVELVAREKSSVARDDVDTTF